MSQDPDPHARRSHSGAAAAEDGVYLTSCRAFLRWRLLPAAVGAPVVVRGAADRRVAGVLVAGSPGHPQGRGGDGGPTIRCGLGLLLAAGGPATGEQPFAFRFERGASGVGDSPQGELERHIREAEAPDRERARELIARVARWRLSLSDADRKPGAPAAGTPRVAVVDPRAAGASRRAGHGGGAALRRLVAAARGENPDAEVVVCRSAAALAGCRRVYVTESPLGFDALLAGVPVTCLGTPWYAGWGLTDDRVAFSRPRPRRSLESVFLAAYEHCARYVDPVTGEACGLAAVLDRLEHHAREAARLPRRPLCVAFRWVRRAGARPFLDGGSGAARFVRTVEEARRRRRDGDEVVVWGLRQPAAEGVWRMEDGFLRSVGLGTDLVRPASLVLDSRGLYFDPRRPSDLEHLLATHEFAAAELARGEALVRRLRESRVTKYNVGRHEPLDLAAAGGRRRVLVPGQAEDDWSIEAGRLDVATNAGLLAAARAAEPDAYIVFKPHPVVLAGQRPGRVPDEVALRWADRVIADVDMAQALEAVDGVHTVTSQTGFEALVRGRTVHTYGMPFYAGWGLTVDRHSCPRRGRALPLAALVYATLVMYPLYFHWRSRLFVGPEEIIAELEDGRGGEVAILPRSPAGRLRRDALLAVRRVDREVRRAWRRLAAALAPRRG